MFCAAVKFNVMAAKLQAQAVKHVKAGELMNPNPMLGFQAPRKEPARSAR